MVLVGEVWLVDDLDVHGLHGFFELVVLALFDEADVDFVLDVGVALELHVFDDLLREV